jgi:uncharacterized OB-fold protein
MLAIDDVPTTGSHIGPRRDGVDAQFWQGLSAGELPMQRCSHCQAWWWVPAWRCGECGSWDLHWEVVPQRGRVFSWIRTHQRFSPAFTPVTPYVTLLVELPDAGNRRLFGVLVGPEDGLEVGAAVTGEIQKPSALTAHMPVLRWKLANQ